MPERGPSGTGHDTAIVCPRCDGQKYDRGSCGLCGNLGALDLNWDRLVAPDPRVTEAAPAPWSAEDWDDWIGLHTNRNDVAESYATGLRVHGTDWTQWPDMNAAILRRWSPAGLTYIKGRAWKIATQNL